MSRVDGQLEELYDTEVEVAEDRDLVGMYLDEIARTRLLTAADEVELAEAIEAGLYAEQLLAEGAIPDGVDAIELATIAADGRAAKRRFINANLRLVGVDDSAIDLLYEASREVCAYSEDGLRRIGFGDGVPGVRVYTPAQIASQQLFFDMRHVSRAFEQLGGESVRQFAEEQYDRGRHRAGPGHRPRL